MDFSRADMMVEKQESEKAVLQGNEMTGLLAVLMDSGEVDMQVDMKGDQKAEMQDHFQDVKQVVQTETDQVEMTVAQLDYILVDNQDISKAVELVVMKVF